MIWVELALVRVKLSRVWIELNWGKLGCVEFMRVELS